MTATLATISPPSGEDLAQEAGTWLNEDGNEPWTGYFDGITRDRAQRRA